MATEYTLTADFTEARFNNWFAEVQRQAKAEAISEFSNELVVKLKPEHGSHINMTLYREGVLNGINRAVIAADRRAAQYRDKDES